MKHLRAAIDAMSMLSRLLTLVGYVLLGVQREDTMAHGAPLTVEQTLVGLFDSAAQDINVRLATAARQLEGDPESRGALFRQTREAELLAQVQRIKAKYESAASPLILAANESAYHAGLANSEKQLAAMGVKEVGDAIGGVSMNLINERAIEAIARDTTARMNDALGTHADNAVKLFRSFSTGPLAGHIHEAETNKIIARGIISGDPRGAIRELRGVIASSEELEGTYRKVGNKLIEVGDATMSVRHYARTVIRTRTREATTNAQINRQLSVGIDLAQITGLKSDNFCSDYLGLVVVLRGPARGDYIAIAEIGKPPFHPNCSKTLTAFSPGLVSEARLQRAAAASIAYRASLMERAAA